MKASLYHAQKNLKSYETWLRANAPPVFSRRIEEIEKLNLPPFALSWEPFVDFWEFMETYVRRNHALWDHILTIPTGELGVRSRASRAFSSLCREHHLYLLLKTKYDVVVRDMDLDLYQDCDVLLIEKGVPYSIKAFVDSPVSRKFRSERVQDKENLVGVAVELPMVLDKADRVGYYCLYNESLLAPLFEVVSPSQMPTPN